MCENFHAVIFISTCFVPLKFKDSERFCLLWWRQSGRQSKVKYVSGIRFTAEGNVKRKNEMRSFCERCSRNAGKVRTVANVSAHAAGANEATRMPNRRRRRPCHGERGSHWADWAAVFLRCGISPFLKII